MKNITQAKSNPFPHSDTNKRYYTYDYYLKNTHGGKCAKLPLDGGMSCPNIDGTCSTGGCIYCSDRGSGDFAPNGSLSVKEQLKEQRARYSSKWQTDRIIAYFQAHSNTYAPLERLKELYEAALSEEGVVGLNIATRADCLAPDVLEYLAQLSHRTTLTVELGLQSSLDKTAALINRGHDFATFCRGFDSLRQADRHIRIGVHLIFGLPGETHADMLKSVRAVARLHPDEVKLHLLHVLSDTPMQSLYEKGAYLPMERTDYIRTVADALELLPPDVVIGRLTGDGAPDALIAPLWSRKKTTVINDIDKLLYERGSYQGAKYQA